MSTNKRISNFTDFTGVLPYASEIFGIYQPLLGWKSKRIEKRFQKGLNNDKKTLLNLLKDQFTGKLQIEYGEGCEIKVLDLKPGNYSVGNINSFDSIVLSKISEKLPDFDNYKESIWKDLISDENIEIIFKEFVTPHYKAFYQENCKGNESPFPGRNVGRINSNLNAKALFDAALEKQLKYESALAGSLLFLAKNKNFEELKNTFYNSTNNKENAIKLIKALSAEKTEDAYLSLENLNPRDKEEIKSVALSPISVVHLFRQYFFELDTFLGTPVGHVWLSPGSSVELIEVSTRKTIVEKNLETILETLTKSEKSTTDQDEISDAVKEDNKQDIKFGASVTASFASVTATSNFDFNNSQQRSREETHKRMRQQTEKLSTEIRKNVKSTFKTITEVTDTSSKRYLLANTTNELINYEMRRKMRQVGVQVQDIGTYLCWQTYVDDPGKDLGIAKLVNIAKSPDLDNIPHPEEILPLQPKQEKKQIPIPFIQASEDRGKLDEAYRDGIEVDTDFNEGDIETIQADFQQTFNSPQSGYTLSSVDLNASGNAVTLSHSDIVNSNGEASFNIHLDYVNFRGQDKIDIELVLNWQPDDGLNEEIRKKNEANLANFKEKEKAAAEKAFVDNVKERIKLASKIQSRPSEELREEERIVVYRKLIQDMLSNGIDMSDDRTRHIVSELINSIFDVDKMLYFVAPEWWRPRLHHTHQQLEETKPISQKFGSMAINALQSIVSSTVNHKFNEKIQSGFSIPKLNSSTVGWGGVNENNRDNYYITEDSEPAKLGSSLGWLLQLDGDNMRNAFLNAPWVKAVIPIRPGKEEAAINWLKGVEGFNGIGDDDVYHANNPENEKDSNGQPLDGQKLIDVLFDLAKKIKKKHEEGIKNGQFPKQENVANPELVDAQNVVTSTPIDRVYEHGFYALKGGFRSNVKGNYEIFDQWIEILPTDQVVPVEVKYDPKTGTQI